MAGLQDEEVAIDLDLLIRSGVYQFFNQKSKKIFNWNVYQLAFSVFTFLVFWVMIFGMMGFFAVKSNFTENFVFLMPILYTCFLVLRLCIFVYNSRKMWSVFDVAKVNFFTSKQCQKYVKHLYKHRKRCIQLNNFFSICIFCNFIQWIIFPFVYNLFIAESKNLNKRTVNIFNMRYPVSTYIYNRYYFLFYLLDLLIAIFTIPGTFIFDSFLLIFCFVIIAQLKVLARSFKTIGYEDKSQIEHYQDFISVLYDQQQLYLKIKSFFSVTRPIVLIYLGIAFGLVIPLLYCCVLERHSSISLFKLGTSLTSVFFQLFGYCYLLSKINSEIELMNFEIYSCNWTQMDLKFQKLMLMTMRINDANQLKITVTPRRIVDLQFYSRIVMKSYNIVSVMLKTIENDRI